MIYVVFGLAILIFIVPIVLAFLPSALLAKLEEKFSDDAKKKSGPEE